MNITVLFVNENSCINKKVQIRMALEHTVY